MKKGLILGAIFLVGNLYAHNAAVNLNKGQYLKDYMIDIDSLNVLKEGNNKIYAKILHDFHTHNDLNMRLVVKSSNEQNSYAGVLTKENGKYEFNINIPTKGKYYYTLSFNHLVGMQHNINGSFRVGE